MDGVVNLGGSSNYVELADNQPINVIWLKNEVDLE